MKDQQTLFAGPPAYVKADREFAFGAPQATPPKQLARLTDPETSHKAAKAASYRSGTQKALILTIYRAAEPDGLTDEEVAELAGMERHAATKRCSDLRNDGAIEPVGIRLGRSGHENRVCRVAEAWRSDGGAA